MRSSRRQERGRSESMGVGRTVKRASAGGGNDNLVHALTEWAAESEPDLLLLGSDLPTVASASRLSLEDLKKEVVSISKEFRVLEVKLEEFKSKAKANPSNGGGDGGGKEQEKDGGGDAPQEDGDKFVDTVEPFLARSKGTLDKLRSEQARVEEAYRNAAVKFGENPKTTANEDFFDVIKKVVLMIDTADRENRERADAEKARIRRQERANKRQVLHCIILERI
eukprot:jgi/Undpi1/13418/HiC_scaffold_8.g03077.m1